MVASVGAACAFCVFLLMSHEGQWPHAVMLGLPLMGGAVAGLCAALGLLNPEPGARKLSETALWPMPGEPRWAAPYSTVPVAAALFGSIMLVLGGHGAPIAIAVALLVLFVSALRRPALLVFVVASLLYLPMLGAYGLWDPWETHYGEVSREILSRDDWISLWWAQDRWFWSKPILIFWAEALLWNALGVGFHPDQNPVHTEWVLRLPIYAMSMAGLLAVYAAMARIWNKRVGAIAAIVLATTPYYAFLTHQAITDMPFVANMTVAMMLLALALAEDPDREAPRLAIGRFNLSIQHAVIALIVGLALPQILYLVSRNVTFARGVFAWHRDVFMFGSAGNGGIPGNMDPREDGPFVQTLVLQPLGQALFWSLGLAGIVHLLQRERRVASLYMFAFYAFCALAFMAKGIPGFALPGLVAAFALLASGRFSTLFEGRLRVAAGALVLIVIGMPWFVAMYMRHGPGFTDRILVHDHINRLTSGVHGDNGTIQYFIWQLGYGLFPLVGLVPAALGSWFVAARAAAGDAVLRARRDTLYLLGLWFAASFTLFSAMTTKFHHYIFPAVPPIAMLTGLLLDRMLPENAFAIDRRGLIRSAAGLLAPLPLVLGLAGLRGDVRGILPEGLSAAERARWVFEHAWPEALCWALLAVGIGLFAITLWMGQEESKPPALMRARQPLDLALGVAAVSGAAVLAFVGRDLSWHTREAPPGSERLIHLFVYNYSRVWPEQFDYRAIGFGFSAATVLLLLAAAVRRLRSGAATGLIGIALLFGVFCLDVYMIDLSPHWTQQGLITRYYKERKSAEEPLLAWQMNWKGENFYTGNRVHVFVELDNKNLLDWVGKNKGRTVFLLLEHTRLERLKNVLAPRKVEPLTTQRDCNKFVLVRTKL